LRDGLKSFDQLIHCRIGIEKLCYNGEAVVWFVGWLLLFEVEANALHKKVILGVAVTCHVILAIAEEIVYCACIPVL
jgi:hypothetical protein